MLLLPLPLCSALDNGLALTPPLGWRSFVSSAPRSHVMCMYVCACVRAALRGVRRRAREWYFVCRATEPHSRPVIRLITGCWRCWSQNAFWGIVSQDKMESIMDGEQ
eukprot:COSAG01_NODE_23399_length_816_cov_7.453278_1_plen_107_part_00